MGSIVHTLLTLPKQAWWLIAILAGLYLLGGGKSKPKKKKSDGGWGSIVVIGGALLLFAGLGGGAVKVPAVHHAVTRVFGSGGCSGLGSVTAAEINGAAAAIGISCKIVRAQINEESGGDPSAVSPTGAQGVAQFEPYSWHCPGSPFNVADAMNCYAVFMRGLLHQEGNIRDALAAYNAGPGNLSGGMGYADTILAAAGQ